MNLPGNGTESVVAWNALAVDGAWHGSALIPLVVNTAGRFSSGSLCVDIRKKHFRRIVSLFATLGVPMSLFAALGVPMRKETPECAKKHQEATGGPGQPREGGRRMPGETPRSPGRPPTGSKIAQDSPKMTQDAPKRPPAGPKTGPRWPQDNPKMAQDCSKTAQDCPKMAPGGPRWPQDNSKTARNNSKTAQDGHESASRWPQGGPRWPQMASRWPQHALKITPREPTNRLNIARRKLKANKNP